MEDQSWRQGLPEHELNEDQRRKMEKEQRPTRAQPNGTPPPEGQAGSSPAESGYAEAERKAKADLIKWIKATGAVAEHGAWRYELESIVEDAVRLGYEASA